MYHPGTNSFHFSWRLVRKSVRLNARIVGKNHVKLTVYQESVCSAPYSGIAFQQAEKFDAIQQGQSMNICYHIEENERYGVKSIQLYIKDVRFSDEN